MQPAIAIAVALACLGACGREAKVAAPARAATIDAALGRAAHFLIARQRADGAIPSRTYAALKDGWSLTPLAVLALRLVPPDAAAQAAYRRGVDYIATLAGPGGAIREAPEVSYPLYAYAIGALVLGAPDNRRHRPVHAKLLEALRALQLSERTGWGPADPSFGGWGYATRPPLRTDPSLDESARAANLSATLLATGALVLGGVPLADPGSPDRGWLSVRSERCCPGVSESWTCPDEALSEQVRYPDSSRTTAPERRDQTNLRSESLATGAGQPTARSTRIRPSRDRIS